MLMHVTMQWGWGCAALQQLSPVVTRLGSPSAHGFGQICVAPINWGRRCWSAPLRDRYSCRCRHHAGVWLVPSRCIRPAIFPFHFWGFNTKLNGNSHGSASYQKLKVLGGYVCVCCASGLAGLARKLV